MNTLLGRVTLDPAGMHCPSWDDAFVSSCLFVLSPALHNIFHIPVAQYSLFVLKVPLNTGQLNLHICLAHVSLLCRQQVGTFAVCLIQFDDGI